MPREKTLQTKILNDIDSWGAKSISFKIVKCGTNGVPDVFFSTVFSGPVFIEVKDAGKKPQEAQKFMIKKLRACGTPAYICDSWDRWVEIKKALHLSKENILNAARLFKS